MPLKYNNVGYKNILPYFPELACKKGTQNKPC
jgi:hypothetical protein